MGSRKVLEIYVLIDEHCIRYSSEIDDRKQCISIYIFLSLVLSLNVLFVHPNGHNYPMFCRRTNGGDIFWKSQVLGDS